jgi:hypothetical protein
MGPPYNRYLRKPATPHFAFYCSSLRNTYRYRTPRCMHNIALGSDHAGWRGSLEAPPITALNFRSARSSGLFPACEPTRAPRLERHVSPQRAATWPLAQILVALNLAGSTGGSQLLLSRWWLVQYEPVRQIPPASLKRFKPIRPVSQQDKN